MTKIKVLKWGKVSNSALNLHFKHYQLNPNFMKCSCNVFSLINNILIFCSHQSQHARRLFDGSAASQEAHDHHQSARRDQDVNT